MQSAYACAPFSSDELILSDAKPIGMGNRRYVFAHPVHENLCLKIPCTAHIRQNMNRRNIIYRFMPTHWRDDNWLESRAYRRGEFKGEDNAVWRHFPRLYGWQRTDIGVGLVFDYYRSETLAPAPNLHQALEVDGLTTQIKAALDRLMNFIDCYQIWMRHPNPSNNVLASDSELKLIDCLGTYNMPLVRYLPAVRRRHAERNKIYLQEAVRRVVSNGR